MLPSAMPSRISCSQTSWWQLVGQQDHHEIAAAGGLDDGQHLEALLARLGDRGGVLAQPDDDVDAGVLQVERVGVALRAVADDGDGLAVEQREVCVVVVDHWRQAIQLASRRVGVAALRRSRAATSVRPGISSVPSAAVYGREALGQRRAGSRCDLRLRARRARRRGSCARGRASSPRTPRSSRGGARSSSASTRISAKPACSSSSRTRSARRPARTAPACPAPGGAVRPRSRSSRAGQQRPGVVLERVPHGQRDAPARAQHAARLAQRRGGSAISM